METGDVDGMVEAAATVSVEGRSMTTGSVLPVVVSLFVRARARADSRGLPRGTPVGVAGRAPVQGGKRTRFVVQLDSAVRGRERPMSIRRRSKRWRTCGRWCLAMQTCGPDNQGQGADHAPIPPKDVQPGLLDPSDDDRRPTCRRARAAERTRRRAQYAMRDRLRAGWGFAQIDTIDDDLGRSASGGAERAGVGHMVAEVCRGKVGAVAAREVSRFARNSRDWQQLIEMCRVVDTVPGGQGGMYAPRQGNNRLLPG